MTAKEYCNYIEIFRQISNTSLQDTIVSMLQDFATIKCKEQRELCGLTVQEECGDLETCGYVYEKVVSTKQPEV